ncbi:MAG TPA: hypothetical protein VFC85_01720 [Verrucomicrobiae bacterium]|nr:hypothetical protein [Verrucomicrobiae bacterium]
MNNEFQPLADALYRERVLRARRMPPEERMLDGIRLYDQAVGRMRLGVKLQNPNAEPNEIERLLKLRIRKLWKMSDYGCYKPA